MSDYPHREARRRTFDEVAVLYATARRPYPDEVVAGLVRLAGLAQDSAVVEIGCGTGQATLPLAARGLRITCVELGSRLAEIARRNVADYPQVEVVEADFEQWAAPRHDYDAVVSFNAFPLDRPSLPLPAHRRAAPPSRLARVRRAASRRPGRGRPVLP